FRIHEISSIHYGQSPVAFETEMRLPDPNVTTRWFSGGFDVARQTFKSVDKSAPLPLRASPSGRKLIAFTPEVTCSGCFTEVSRSTSAAAPLTGGTTAIHRAHAPPAAHVVPLLLGQSVTGVFRRTASDLASCREATNSLACEE